MELNKIKEPSKLQMPGRILGIATIAIASVSCSSQPEFEVGAYWRGSQTADFVDPNAIDFKALNGGIDYFAAPLSPTGDIETRDPDFRATYDQEVNAI